MTGDGDTAVRTEHGLHPAPKALHTARREACRELIRALEDGAVPGRYFELAEAAQRLHDVFRDVTNQTKGDWFLSSSRLSHPSQPLAHDVSRALQGLIWSLNGEKASEVSNLLNALKKKRLPSMLEHYLATTRVKSPLPFANEGNWIYMLRSNDDWGTFYLGTIEGTVEDALVEMDEANSDLAPYGIAAAWRTKGLDRAFECAAETLEHALLEDDFYKFQDLNDLNEMRETVGKQIRALNLLEFGPSYQSSAWQMDYGRRNRIRHGSKETDAPEVSDPPVMRPSR